MPAAPDGRRAANNEQRAATSGGQRRAAGDERGGQSSSEEQRTRASTSSSDKDHDVGRPDCCNRRRARSRGLWVRREHATCARSLDDRCCGPLVRRHPRLQPTSIDQDLSSQDLVVSADDMSTIAIMSEDDRLVGRSSCSCLSVFDCVMRDQQSCARGDVRLQSRLVEWIERRFVLAARRSRRSSSLQTRSRLDSQPSTGGRLHVSAQLPSVAESRRASMSLDGRRRNASTRAAEQTGEKRACRVASERRRRRSAWEAKKAASAWATRAHPPLDGCEPRLQIPEPRAHEHSRQLVDDCRLSRRATTIVETSDNDC